MQRVNCKGESCRARMEPCWLECWQEAGRQSRLCGWGAGSRGWGAMHWFPRAAKTSFYKVGVLKQQKFILSQFWESEVLNQGFGRVLLPLKALKILPGISQLLLLAGNLWCSQAADESLQSVPWGCKESDTT